MKNSNIMLIIFLIFIHLLCMPNKARSCKTMNCRRNNINASMISLLQIKFPFRVIDHQFNKSCGSPGFDLYCDNKLGSLLQLPNAGNFTINSIHYTLREIELSDLNDCLPQKLLALNLSTTPFRGISKRKDFWVYNCSGIFHRNHMYDEIGCFKGSNYKVVSVSAGESVNDANCSLLKIVSVPTNHDTQRRLSRYSSIRLTWDEQDCKSCESLTMTSPTKNFPATITKSYRMMVVVVSVFVVMVLIFIALFLYFWMSNNNYREQFTTVTNEQETNGTVNTSISTTSDDQDVVGLDHITIDSYPMAVIGASGHMIKPGDDKCPICLSDYFPGNRLIILPECLHRFHDDCIHLWLSANPTCPICRTTPGISHNY